MSEDCQKCGTARYELDEERLCPNCSDTEPDDSLAPDEPEEGDFGSDEYERTINQRY